MRLDILKREAGNEHQQPEPLLLPPSDVLEIEEIEGAIEDVMEEKCHGTPLLDDDEEIVVELS